MGKQKRKKERKGGSDKVPKIDKNQIIKKIIVFQVEFFS